MKTAAKRINKSESIPAQHEPQTNRFQPNQQPGPTVERRLLAPGKETNKTEAATNPSSEGQQCVHFEISEPSARKICIAGSFNDWNPQAIEMIPLGGGKWTKDLTLRPGTYEYRLVVDGKWIPDPNASQTVPNPFGEPNSLLNVPEGELTVRR